MESVICKDENSIEQGLYSCYALLEDMAELTHDNLEEMVLGYVNTGVKVIMFDVDYIVLEMDLGKKHDEKTFRNCIRHIIGRCCQSNCF